MSMLRDDDDYMEVRKEKKGIVLGLLLAVSAVVLVLTITFAMNKQPEKPAQAAKVKEDKAATEEIDLSETEGSKRTSNELSFWHMYDNEEENNTVVPSITDSGEDDRVKEKFVPEEKEPLSDNAVSENTAGSQQHERDTVSENVFDVNELSEGHAQFVNIDNRIPGHNRFDEGFENEGIWKDYALNGRKTSFRGIDVSSYQKDIEWDRVASSGVDFAMLRVGSRGYSSGKVVLDENLLTNMRGCSENSVKIGLYFQSQAANVIEAVEEANYCVASINGYNIEYPIVFSSESIVNDSYRTENLSKEELSAIARAFCDTIRLYGYKPMIAGTKKQFAMKMDLLSLNGYDLWLYDTDEISVFPYRYNMWQYNVTGEVEGIEGPVDLDIAFVDYSVK